MHIGKLEAGSGSGDLSRRRCQLLHTSRIRIGPPRRLLGRTAPLPLMAGAQACLAANAIVLRASGRTWVTLVLPVLALALVSAALLLWAHARRDASDLPVHTNLP